MDRQNNQQNISYSQQNILANSIRIARQRIGKNAQLLTNQNNEKDNLHNQTFSFSKPKKQNSAAQAIKFLHKRIAQLQAFNVTLTKQNSQTKKQLNLKNLQLQSYKSGHQDMQERIQQYKKSIQKIQKVLAQREGQLTQMKLKQKMKQQRYSQIILQKTKAIKDSQIIIQGLQDKVVELNKRIDNNQKIIVQFIKQLQQQKSKNSTQNTGYNSPNMASKEVEKNKDSRSVKQKQQDNFPVIVQEPDNSKDYHIYKIESSKKFKSIRSSCQTKVKNKSLATKNQNNLQMLIKELKEKNHQLYNMLRSANSRFKQQQKAKIEYKQRFYSLKNATDLIIQQINRLPNNFSHKFKCLIVKVKKIQNDNLECLRSHSTLNRNRIHSKSLRNSSKQSSAQSKSRQKQLKMQDLSLTDNQKQQSEPRSHSKSKRRSITTFIKSHSGKKQTRAAQQQQASQNEVIRILNKKIRQQRKQICEMSKRIKNQSDKQKIKAMNIEIQQKINKNIELIAELNTYKKEKAKLTDQIR